MEKNKARNKCLNRNTRVNREDYEQKRSEARNLFKKKKRELLKKEKIEEIRESKEKKLTRKFYEGIKELNRPYQSESVTINPSACGHLNPSSYCDVGRLFYGVFKLWSKLQRKK